jgi:heme iron utilization protein
METDKDFRKQLKELFGAQNLAALSTHRAGQPYASLVAFYGSADLRRIYFVTPKTTRKYANLLADSRVAIMVNNSTNHVSDFHRAISVTAVGTAAEVVDAQRSIILQQFLGKHPQLEDFVNSPTIALIEISVDRYYMVSRFQNVMELHLKP